MNENKMNAMNDMNEVNEVNDIMLLTNNCSINVH